MKKKFTAFISYAHADEEIAKDIQYLFKMLNHQTYFAPVALREDAGDEWRSKVVQGVKLSNCIVPIYTRNSIHRPWVLYELGVADAYDLQKYPARVADISPEEADLPGKGVQIFKLYDIDDLVDLFTNAISLIENPEGNEAKKLRRKESVKELLLLCPETDRIIKRSKARWVFIAGSLPLNVKSMAKETAFSIKSEVEFNNKVGSFLSKLTTKLLEEGFSIAACPQVENVGKVVSAEAISWITLNQQQTIRYKIGGIYPIDRDLRELDIDEGFKSVWKKHLIEFRKKYLEGHEWVIIVGGNEGTIEEYTAAKDMNVKILPIPCFRGTGRQLWERNKSLQKGPCLSCNNMDGDCSERNISEIVKELKKSESV